MIRYDIQNQWWVASSLSLKISSASCSAAMTVLGDISLPIAHASLPEETQVGIIPIRTWDSPSQNS
jgi:hypothetical protein